MKSISLIQALVLIDQGKSFIKPPRFKNLKIDYFEATKESLALAQKLADQILGKDLSISVLETRVLLLLIEGMVDKACTKKSQRSGYQFTLKNILEYTGWRLKIIEEHVNRLEKLGYLHRSSKLISLLYKGRSVQIVKNRIGAS